jgi:hypothetical protein
MLGFSLFCIYLVIACIAIYYLRSSHQQKWWVKIVTQSPCCTYYFGPFESLQEAQHNQTAYFQDIQAEGAQNISLQIEQCKPRYLTACQGDPDVSIGY